MSDCINLREEFGDRYRVSYEESYRVDLGKGVRRGDPWLQVIECTGGRGHFFPWGGTKLAISVDRPGVAKKIMRLACGKVVQDGSDGCTCVFDIGDFDVLAEIMKPKRRRKLSAEHRARSIAQLESWQQLSRGGDDQAAVHRRAADFQQASRPATPTEATKSQSPA